MLKVALLSLTFLSSLYVNCNTLKRGIPAPKFSAIGDDNKRHNLSEYKGKKLVLYFYPKNGTPWCTLEAKGFRDNFALFKRNNIEVLGVSYDSVEKHQEFKAKHQLPFILLSDPESQISELYEAKGLILNSRITYIIDENGIINHIFTNVVPKTHAQDVLKYLKIIK